MTLLKCIKEVLTCVDHGSYQPGLAVRECCSTIPAMAYLRVNRDPKGGQNDTGMTWALLRSPGLHQPTYCRASITANIMAIFLKQL